MISALPSRIAGTEIDPHALRVNVLQHGRRLAFPLPDGLLALVFAAAALIQFIPPPMIPMALVEARQDLMFLLIVEGGFLLAQGTLIDIATRLRKRPPIWLAALILIGVVLVSNYTLDVLRMAWARGSVVFFPLLLSIAERGTVLWRMPDRPTIEKIAARALIANRITTGLALLGVVTITMVVSVAFPNLYSFDSINEATILLAGAAYFLVAAFDAWRVRGAKFAEKPRVLFRWDPIGIDYLEPV